MSKVSSKARENAETVALQAFGWLAGNEELMPVFLGATGIAPEDIRSRATKPEFLLAVLDFILMDDAWVIAFCNAAGLDYAAPQTARQLLPGGAQRHWT